MICLAFRGVQIGKSSLCLFTNKKYVSRLKTKTSGVMDEKTEFEIIASAPAKVILFGEHSVVYGAPAIAASINRRTTVSIAINDEETLRLIFTKLDLDVRLPLTELKAPQNLESQKQRAIECCLMILTNLEPLTRGIIVRVSSEFPLGAGLGSSASLAVSLSAALLANEAAQKGESIPKNTNGTLSEGVLKKIKELADNCERMFHGNPSGIDTATCSLGGIVRFEKNVGVTKIADSLPMKIAVVDSKVERQTSKIVENVRNLRSALPDATSAIFEGMKQIAATAVSEISNNSSHNILDLVRMNHGLLYSLGVSHPELERIGLSVSDLNVGFKLTGAGAGGNALIFIPPDTSDKVVVENLKRNGYEGSIVSVGVDGVQVEIKP